LKGALHEARTRVIAIVDIMPVDGKESAFAVRPPTMPAPYSRRPALDD
jgi:hypothetical protein